MPTILIGTEDADYLIGGDVDDPNEFFDEALYGNGGDDILVLFSRPGQVWGGDGNDYITGGSSDDWLVGEAGSDSIFGNGGHDLILGGDGNDSIQAGWGHDTIYGGGGDDFISGLGYSGSGSAADGDNDVIDGGAGHDTIYGGAGVDVIYGDDSYTVSRYATNPNYLTTVRNIGNDAIYGGDGNDWLFGFGGNDTLNGNAGDDVILGGSGEDLIFDLEGNNLIATGTGADNVQTGDGNDTIYSGGYEDYTAPRPGLNRDGYTLDAGDHPVETDLFAADSGAMWTYGRAGLGATGYWIPNYGFKVDYSESPAEVINTGTGDTIASGGGDDIIYGGEFDDTMLDGEGNDYVSTGGGEDIIYNGGGVDLIQLVGTVPKPFLAPGGVAGGYLTLYQDVLNPEVLIYDNLNAVGADDLDYIYGFDLSDQDKIMYDDALGTDVAFTAYGDDVWLANGLGIFAVVDNASVADVMAAFEYF